MKVAALALLVGGGAALLGVSAARGDLRPLEGTHDSPRALAAAVLDAFARRDRDALERLALSEEEFRTRVWPSLPSARPERNLPVQFVWQDLHGKSRAYLSSSLARPLPPGARITDLAFDGEVTDYRGFRVHRRSRITLADAAGIVTSVRLFGSMIEQDGRFKVFSYVTD